MGYGLVLKNLSGDLTEDEVRRGYVGYAPLTIYGNNTLSSEKEAHNFISATSNRDLSIAVKTNIPQIEVIKEPTFNGKTSSPWYSSGELMRDILYIRDHWNNGIITPADQLSSLQKERVFKAATAYHNAAKKHKDAQESLKVLAEAAMDLKTRFNDYAGLKKARKEAEKTLSAMNKAQAKVKRLELILKPKLYVEKEIPKTFWVLGVWAKEH